MLNVSKITVFAAIWLSSMLLPVGAQQREKYEFRRNLPIYADSLLKDLTYPLAFENSGLTFDIWKATARQKVLDCMLEPPPSVSTNGVSYKILCEEQRDGYKAKKIEVRLSRYYTVPAYILIPDGKGPFPAE